MAQTYDLSSNIPNAADLRTGDIINCPYSGNYKTITLPKGTYKLECWGAQGGSYNTTYVGGKGGYSYGTLTLTEETTLYLYVGGAGAKLSKTGAAGGGFNGGGNGYTTSADYLPGAGGGGSDIRIRGSNYNNRIIVAGGGGGAHGAVTGMGNGGYGGGTTGGAGASSSTTYTPGAGGTATAAGNSYYGATANDSSRGTLGGFGFGGAPSSSYGAGGGGGWYGGGYARRAGGGGGSGYVYTSATASQHPNNSGIGSSYYLTNASTKAGNTSFTDYSGATVTGHSGNGAIRITALSIGKNLLLVKTNSNTWNEVIKIFMKITNDKWANLEIGG